MSTSSNISIIDWETLKQSRAVLPSFIVALFLFLFSTLYFQPEGLRGFGDVILRLLDPWPFLTKRHDFLWSNFQKTGRNIFSFKVLQFSVTAVKGEQARKRFFEDNKNLNFGEGYKILNGTVPVKEQLASTDPEKLSFFNKNLGYLTKKERMSEVVPILFDDIQHRMDGWGKEGRLDPFKNVYDLVFQMTIRMASCDELSSDFNAVTRLQKAYWELESNTTPIALLFPWFPSAAKKKRTKAMQDIFVTIFSYVMKRKEAPVPSSDFIDVLLAQGVDGEQAVGIVIGIIFAGVLNTGIIACWILFYIGMHQEWKQKIFEEVHSLIQKYTNTTSSEPLHKRLSEIPISAWEDEMSSLDLVIRETLRITFNATALRRNVQDDLNFQGKTLPKGEFVAYSLADTHLNPDIYPNPKKFEPERFTAGREEDKKQAHAFLGWGAGRHPCTGMKVAKLEIKFIVAMFAAGYDYNIVDRSGNPSKSIPEPDLNDTFQASPKGEPCFVQFKRVQE